MNEYLLTLLLRHNVPKSYEASPNVCRTSSMLIGTVIMPFEWPMVMHLIG